MKTRTNYTKIIAGILLFAAIVVGGWIALSGLIPTTGISSEQSQPAAKPAAAKRETSITFTAVDGKTVLAQLKAKANVTTKQSDFGTLVESINGLKNGTDGKYWLFYIDGKMAPKGADALVTGGGEVVEWKFEK